MQIRVISRSEPVTKSGANNSSWKTFDLEYEANGKVSTRKIVSFKDEYDALVTANPGDEFNVVVKKVGKFYDWSVGASEAGQGSSSAATQGVAESHQSSGKSGKSSYTTRPGGSYETPEERAAKQELIVRQSSITAALTFCKDDTEGGIEQVLHVAKEFRDWVYQVEPLGNFAKVNMDLQGTPRVE